MPGIRPGNEGLGVFSQDNGFSHGSEDRRKGGAQGTESKGDAMSQGEKMVGRANVRRVEVKSPGNTV